MTSERIIAFGKQQGGEGGGEKVGKAQGKQGRWLGHTKLARVRPLWWVWYCMVCWGIGYTVVLYGAARVRPVWCENSVQAAH